jgi:hypothetical protein
MTRGRSRKGENRMNRTIYGLLAVGLIAGPVVASAQVRAVDTTRVNWTDSWKLGAPGNADPGYIAALATYEQVNRESPGLIAAFQGGAYLPGQIFVSSSTIGRSSFVSGGAVAAAGVAAPEIDPTSAAAGLTLLLGGLAVLGDRRAKQGSRI